MPEQEWKVEAIVDRRVVVRPGRPKRIEYQIKWEGWEDSDNTWEPLDNIFCADKVEEFEKKRAAQKAGDSADEEGTSSQTADVDPENEKDVDSHPKLNDICDTQDCVNNQK